MKPEYEGYYWVARVRKITVADREIEEVEELIAYFDPESEPEHRWFAEGVRFGLNEFQQVNKFLGTSANTDPAFSDRNDVKFDGTYPISQQRKVRIGIESVPGQSQ